MLKAPLSAASSLSKMAASSTARDAILARTFYTRKGVAVRNIFESVAVGDDVSDFSDISDSDEEEWSVANNAAPGDASDDYVMATTIPDWPKISSCQRPLCTVLGLALQETILAPSSLVTDSARI